MSPDRSEPRLAARAAQQTAYLAAPAMIRWLVLVTVFVHTFPLIAWVPREAYWLATGDRTPWLIN
jgi:hypothetical protein